MRAVLTQIRGQIRKHRLQAAVVFIIVALAAGVGTLALEILNAASAPYARAFEQQVGPHLDIQFDGSKVTLGQLGATAQLPDVTSTGGPWPLKTIPMEFGTMKVPLYVIGRPDPGGAVDRLQIVAGHWATAPGEIVLTRSFAQLTHLRVGDQLTALSRPEKPRLTVVGEAVDIAEADASVMNPQFSWVTADQLTSLLSDGDHADFQMVYRFQHAATDAEIQHDVQQISDSLPPSAVGTSLPHLLIARLFNLTSSLILTFLLAFSAFALVASALIIANMVTGAVLASTREIGIIRALGFTPGQVVASFTGQMMLPALAGSLVGAALGALGSIPILSSSSEALALPTENLVTLWPAFAAALGALVVVVLTAALPALRSGALSPVEALARGTAPRVHRRSRLTGILQHLRVPRILSLGAGDAFVRPVRGLLTTVAVIIGVATLTFGFGLHSSLQRLASEQWLNPDILVTRFGSYPDADLSRTLQARPESAIVVAYTFTAVSVAGDSTPINAIPMRGDSGQLDFQLLQGRWFTGPGEVVSGSAFVKEAHLKIGDMVTVTGTSQSVPLRLVGVYFDTDNFSRVIRFDWASYLQMSQDAQPSMYQVTLRPGADPAAYAREVLASAPDFLSVQARQSSVSPILGALDSVLAVLAVVLSVIAIAGVFNTLLLSTRERARELATLKTVGMTPGQVVGMVVSSAVAYGVIGGIVGIVAGIWLHGALLSLMGQVINDPLPSAIAQNVFGVVTLLALVLIGVLVAVAGASLPAWLAARTRIVQVLHAE